jgi:hypothetical protein
MDIRYIFWPFGICYGHLVFLMVIWYTYLPPFWYAVQRKFWQPCSRHVQKHKNIEKRRSKKKTFLSRFQTGTV